MEKGHSSIALFKSTHDPLRSYSLFPASLSVFACASIGHQCPNMANPEKSAAAAAQKPVSQHLLHWNIDNYLNPWIPHNRLYMLPKPISRFFGHRAQPTEEIPHLMQWPLMFLATVAGLCLVGGVTNYSPGIKSLDPPVVIASLGASAVLDFNVIRSPLSQPRNSITGNTLSALVGVCIAKLFALNSDFQNIEWVAGAVGCACASLAMSLTGTIHPPGGATAVLASTNAQIIRMGWWFIPLVMLGSSLLVATGCIFNNILRQYPMYWWTPADCGSQLRKAQQQEDDVEEKGDHKVLRRTQSTTSRYVSGYLVYVDWLADQI